MRRRRALNKEAGAAVNEEAEAAANEEAAAAILFLFSVMNLSTFALLSLSDSGTTYPNSLAPNCLPFRLLLDSFSPTCFSLC